MKWYLVFSQNILCFASKTGAVVLTVAVTLHLMSRAVVECAKVGCTALVNLKEHMKVMLIDKDSSTKVSKDRCHKEMQLVIDSLDKNLAAIKQAIQGKEGLPKFLKDAELKEKEVADLNEQVRILTAKNQELCRMNDKLANISTITDKVSEMLTEFKRDLPDPALSEVDVTMKKEIKDAVKDNLKEVMTEAVNKIVNTDKMKKTFAEVVNNSQNVIRKETKKCFDESLTSALQESQGEIIARTTARQEADQLEKERRSRNVAISGIPESSAPDNKAKAAADTEFVCELLQIRTDQVEGCYRAGPPIGIGSNKNKEGPRPLIVILESPELAKMKHRYGNGDKLESNGAVLWVNPDLTRAERKANYLARLKRKERLRSRGDATTAAIPTSENSANVVTPEQ